ncbi:MAG: hypothetical protein Q4C95_08155 [Planctomycetia bacterium]|nr:hypothetical protein [Planctomycetia bacterium]
MKTIQKYCCVWFPPNFQTVDSLIEYLTKKQTPRRKKDQTPWTRKEIENDLLDFISRDFAVPRNKLTVHSTFKEYDLF